MAFGHSQILLEANGPGTTYEEINAVLAPGYNAVEVPDCAHNAFGRHIDEVFDNELNKAVFRFFAHVTPDNDRCLNFDRQRTEIKTYDQSPDELLATFGETVEYNWKFKIPDNFQVSSNFTHVHQIKSVGGPFASIPMVTLTLRKGTPDRLELRYTPTNNQTTIATVDLDLLRGEWLEVTENITYLNSGNYTINIRKISDNASLLSYTNNMDTWQDGADFSRPKWGIYRSLNNASDLQDEEVLFADFSIMEIETLDVSNFSNQTEAISLSTNPVKDILSFKNFRTNDYDDILVYDINAKQIDITGRLDNNRLKVSGLDSGLYFIIITEENRLAKVLKFIKE
ncbi:MAG: T9SS type A sorting domain-containing protein [Bacteroidota bacterium]